MTLNANLRTISEGIRDVTLIGPDDPRYSPTLPNSINTNVLEGVQYLNLSAAYDVLGGTDKRAQLFFVVNNVFDTDPPPGGGNNATTAPFYELIGRTFRTGIRFTY